MIPTLLWLALLGGDALAAERWVTLGAVVTETVFALGGGDRVVGVDASSVYPPVADALPEVGGHRRVDVEAVLALRPTRVLAAPDIGPPEALAQLRAAGVPVDVAPEAKDIAGALARVRWTAALMDVGVVGEALSARVSAELAAAPRATGRPSVAFLYARGAGTLLVGGRGAGVDVVVNEAGGVLVGDWEGFRPVTAEALAGLSPDVFLLTTRGLESLGGVQGVLSVPGVSLTPAGRAGRVVAVDDLLLLTLGPRLGTGVDAVAKALLGALGTAL